MKTKIFLLAVIMLSIFSALPAQTYVGGENISKPDSVKVDSVAIAAVASAQKAKLDSIAVAKAIAIAKSDSVKAASAKADAVAGAAEEKNFRKRVGFWIAVGIISAFLIGILFWWLKKQGVVIKNPFAGFSFKAWEDARITKMKARSEGKKVVALDARLAYGKKWKDEEEFRKTVEWWFEGQWFIRKNWKPILYPAGFILAIVAILWISNMWASRPEGNIIANYYDATPDSTEKKVVGGVKIDIEDSLLDDESYSQPQETTYSPVYTNRDTLVIAPYGEYSAWVDVKRGEHWCSTPQERAWFQIWKDGVISEEYADGPMSLLTDEESRKLIYAVGSIRTNSDHILIRWKADNPDHDVEVPLERRPIGKRTSGPYFAHRGI